jgi:hypothetical protein
MERFTTNNTNTDPFIRNNQDTNPAKFGHINAIVDAVTALQNIPPGSGIASVQAGTDISVDNTDPLNPIVNSTVVYSSGTFTPAISDEVDCDVIVLKGIYSRVDNVVTMTLYLSIELDTAGTNGTFNVALPVASTFATARDCYGTATLMVNAIDQMTYYIIAADTATNKCAVEVQGNTGVSTVTDFIATIQYLVL